MAENYLSSLLTGGAATRDDSVTGFKGGFSSALTSMIKDAPPAVQKGIRINSGYRSEATQKRLFDDAVKKYGSKRAARKWVAPPGESGHGRGTSADLKMSAAAKKWVHANAPRYGLHFPMSWEPWHISAQVGTPAASGTPGTVSQTQTPSAISIPGVPQSVVNKYARAPTDAEMAEVHRRVAVAKGTTAAGAPTKKTPIAAGTFKVPKGPFKGALQATVQAALDNDPAKLKKTIMATALASLGRSDEMDEYFSSLGQDQPGLLGAIKANFTGNSDLVNAVPPDIAGVPVRAPLLAQLASVRGPPSSAPPVSVPPATLPALPEPISTPATPPITLSSIAAGNLSKAQTDYITSEANKPSAKNYFSAPSYERAVAENSLAAGRSAALASRAKSNPAPTIYGKFRPAKLDLSRKPDDAYRTASLQVQNESVLPNTRAAAASFTMSPEERRRRALNDPAYLEAEAQVLAPKLAEARARQSGLAAATLAGGGAPIGGGALVAPGSLARYGAKGADGRVYGTTSKDSKYATSTSTTGSGRTVRTTNITTKDGEDRTIRNYVGSGRGSARSRAAARRRSGNTLGGR